MTLILPWHESFHPTRHATTIPKGRTRRPGLARPAGPRPQPLDPARDNELMKKSITAIALAALSLAGCGGTDDSSTDDANSPETAAETATSGVAEAKATAGNVQEALDVVFESCDWQDQGTDTTPITHSCESEELFILTGDSSEVKVITKAVADEIEVPVYATITNTYSVYGADQGKINQAWDVLGADPDAKPHEVK